MIDLKPAVGSDVYIQFKKNVYLMATVQGRFTPIGTGTEQQPGPPMIVDRMEGKIREQDGQYILTYANPGDPQGQIDYLIDPEQVAGVWIARKISIIT